MQESSDVCRVMEIRPFDMRTMRATDLRDRYTKLAAQHHPDKGGDPVVFGQVHSAYKILTSAVLFKQFMSRTIPCADCKGKGQRQVRKGFTGRKESCPACDGYGYTELKNVVVV